MKNGCMNDIGGQKVLVTGGAGFIGSHLVDALLEKKAIVRVIDDLSRGFESNLAPHKNEIEFIRGDLGKEETARAALKDIEACFHLAAVVGSVQFMNNNPSEIFRAVTINNNILEGCRQEGVDRVLFTSSACTYPISRQTAHEQPPLKEDEALKYGASPDGDYGWTKLLGEIQCQAYHRSYGMNIGIVRPFNPYGPKESFDPKDSHVIPSLIRKAIRKENPFIVWGDGTQARAFEYVGDLVEGFILAIQRKADADPINLGSSTPVTIKEIAELVLELTGYNIKITWDKTKPQGVKSRKADMTKATDLLGWTPRVSLRDGLKRTIDWYKEESKYVGGLK
jgi:nucleoside-diphosphate-sugar epimerase